jgi:hypothetical protein
LDIEKQSEKLNKSANIPEVNSWATFDDEGQHAEGMVARAACCGYEIQQRIEELDKEYSDAAIGVGVGINTGPGLSGCDGKRGAHGLHGAR